jgi:hypothetical protein
MARLDLLVKAVILLLGGIALLLWAYGAQATVTVPDAVEYAALVARVAALETQVVVLQAQLATLSARVTALETAAPGPPPTSGLIDSGPIMATVAGQVITGFRIKNPAGPCVVVSAPNVRVQGNEIGPCHGHGVDVHANGVLVVNNTIKTGRTKLGLDASHGVFFRPFTQDGLVQGNVLEHNESGVQATDVVRITVKGNYSKNPLGPFPRGQHVQFWRCNTGGPAANGCVVEGNHFVVEPEIDGPIADQTGVEDGINIGRSDHARAIGNYVRGGSADNGCGIIAETSNHAYLAHNVVIRTSQCGIHVLNGAFSVMEHNKVLDSNLTALGHVSGNTALLNWYKSGQTGCHDNVIRENIASNLQANGTFNDLYQKPPCGTKSGNITGLAARSMLLPEAEKLPPPSPPGIPPIPWTP